MPTERLDTFALASRRVIRFSTVYAIAVVLATTLALVVYTALRNGAADPAELTTQATLMISLTILGMVTLVCGIGLSLSTVVWVISAHRVTPAGPGLAGYGGLALCVLLIILSFALPNRPTSVTTAVALEATLRIGGAALLTAGALLTRARIRRETGRPDLAARPLLVTSDDWDASTWDPTLQREIARRRHTEP